MIRKNRHHAFSTGSSICRVLQLVCCACLALLINQSPVIAAQVEILTPRSGATVIARNPETHLVLRREATGKSGFVKVNTADGTLDPLISVDNGDYSYMHYRLPLKRGKNSFTLEPGGTRIELTYQQIQSDLVYKKAMAEKADFFHLDEQLPKSCQDCHDLGDSRTIEPVGLKQQESCAVCHPNIVNQGAWRHSTTINKQCLTCHLKSTKPWRIGLPVVKTQDICFGCHVGKKAWDTKPYVHGPVYIGGCTLCHNPHGEDYRYQLWAEGTRDLCVICHSDKDNLVTDNPKERVAYVHGIISGGGCVACHSPHASDQQYMINKPTNELCLGCHPQIALKVKGHPVANHPVSAPRERRRPGKELTCVSCHDPHGSENPLMLIKSPLGGQLCRVCHKK